MSVNDISRYLEHLYYQKISVIAIGGKVTGPAKTTVVCCLYSSLKES